MAPTIRCPCARCSTPKTSHDPRPAARRIARLPRAGQAQPLPARHRAPPDGYHTLQTAFQLIDWSDTLHFRRREDGAVVRTTEIPGTGRHRPVVRAARLLQQATGTRFGVDIAVDKRLPMAAASAAARRTPPPRCWP